MEKETVTTSKESTDHAKAAPNVNESAKTIEGLAHQASQVDQGKTLFTPKAPNEKRGPGRPKKNETLKTASPTASADISGTPQQVLSSVPVITTKDALKPTFEVLSGWLGRSLDSRAKFKDEEVDQLATCYGLLLDKWMPTVGEKYAVEVAAIMCTVTVGTRIYAVSADLKAQRQEKMRQERMQNAPRADEVQDKKPTDFQFREQTFGQPQYPRVS